MNLFMLILVAASISVAAGEYIRACYLTQWSRGRPGRGQFDILKHYQDGLCTHIIYSFGKVHHDGVGGYGIDTYDDRDLGANGGFAELKILKKRDPQLKTLFAIGGWTHASNGFTEMVKTRQLRQYFINSAISYLQTHGFDGMDLDWEYPAQRGSVQEDRVHFTSLCKEIKRAFSKRNLLITAAVAAGAGSADVSYEILKISKHLDFINIMSYDLHGKWEGQTGHHTDCDPNTPSSQHSVHNSVNHWLSSGMDPKKLVIGLASYGRTWKLSDPCNKWNLGSKSPWTGGKSGSSTGEAGYLAYFEICNLKWDNHVCTKQSRVNAPYGSSDGDFIGYDDEESITYKVEKILKKKQLGGFMFWALDIDDFVGVCGNGKYPLIKAATAALMGKRKMGNCKKVKHIGKCKPPPTVPPSKNGCRVNPMGPWAGDASHDRWCKAEYNCPGECGDTSVGCTSCMCVCDSTPVTKTPKTTSDPTATSKPDGSCTVPADLRLRKKCYLNPNGPWAGQGNIDKWCKSTCPIDKTCESQMCCCDIIDDGKTTKRPIITTKKTQTPEAKTTKKSTKTTQTLKTTTTRPTEQTATKTTKIIKQTTMSTKSTLASTTKITAIETEFPVTGVCRVPKGIAHKKNCRRNSNGVFARNAGLDDWCRLNCAGGSAGCTTAMCCCD